MAAGDTICTPTSALVVSKFSDLYPKIGRVVALVDAIQSGWDEFAAVVELKTDEARKRFGVVDHLIEILVEEVALAEARATGLGTPPTRQLPQLMRSARKQPMKPRR